MEKSLWEKIITEMESSSQGAPIDIAFMNSDLRDARRIDIDSGVREIARGEQHFGDKTVIDFETVKDAFPPLTDKSIFVEFSAEASLYMGDNAERFGMHIVKWTICKDSLVLSVVTKGVKIPPKLEETYAIIWYMERNGELVVAPIGAIVGLDVEGEVAYRQYFWAGKSGYSVYRFSWSRARSQMAWYIFLVFSCFSKFNSEHYQLRQIGPRSWRI